MVSIMAEVSPQFFFESMDSERGQSFRQDAIPFNEKTVPGILGNFIDDQLAVISDGVKDAAVSSLVQDGGKSALESAFESIIDSMRSQSEGYSPSTKLKGSQRATKKTTYNLPVTYGGFSETRSVSITGLTTKWLRYKASRGYEMSHFSATRALFDHDFINPYFTFASSVTVPPLTIKRGSFAGLENAKQDYGDVSVNIPLGSLAGYKLMAYGRPGSKFIDSSRDFFVPALEMAGTLMGMIFFDEVRRELSHIDSGSAWDWESGLTWGVEE